jgi:hypothetical protein
VKDECPEFSEATRRFAAFLHDQGWPERIQWVGERDFERVSPSEIVVYVRGDDDGAADAQRLFERGRAAEHGVMLSAICTWGEVTCATVSSPRDDAEGGLKLSVAVPRLAGTVRWAAC